MATRMAKRGERECKPNLHANFAAFFRPLIDFSLCFRALLHFLPLHNLIAVIFLKSAETLSNVKTTKNGSQTIRFELLHGSFFRMGNEMEVFRFSRFSFYAVKYREIVVNITQVLINSNIFRCSQYGWHFAINNSSRTN